MKAIAFALLLTCLAVGASAQTVSSVANTKWTVNPSWEPNTFNWTFDANGRYKDSEGPTGSWTQNGASLTLNADAGFIYRCTLAGSYGSGIVYVTKDNRVAGSFWFKRMNAPPNSN